MWRECVTILIEQMPQPYRAVLCARLAAAIPAMWHRLSAKDKKQVRAIIKEAYV